MQKATRLVTVLTLLLGAPALAAATTWAIPTTLTGLAALQNDNKPRPEWMVLMGQASPTSQTVYPIRVDASGFVLVSLTGTGGKVNVYGSVAITTTNTGVSQLGTWTVANSVTNTGVTVLGGLSDVGTLGNPGISASVVLDCALSQITSTPFVTAAAGAAVFALPQNAKWVRVSVTGSATNYARCGLATGTSGGKENMNICVGINSPFVSPILRLGGNGGTLYVGEGDGLGGHLIGGASYGF